MFGFEVGPHGIFNGGTRREEEEEEEEEEEVEEEEEEETNGVGGGGGVGGGRGSKEEAAGAAVSWANEAADEARQMMSWMRVGTGVCTTHWLCVSDVWMCGCASFLLLRATVIIK